MNDVCDTAMYATNAPPPPPPRISELFSRLVCVTLINIKKKTLRT